MDHRRTENFFAVTAPGLAAVCTQELTELGMNGLRCEAEGVSFAGRLADLYRANLHVRTATRILVRFAEFRSRDFPHLFRQAVRLPWGRFIRPGTPVVVRVTCRQSRLIHTGRVQETLRAAISRAVGEEIHSGQAPDAQDILVRILDDQVHISIDSSGERLHRRGYRQAATVAPLRETLAAGILMLLDWQEDVPLYDPMCGTGTFLCEAALLAGRRAPGRDRRFAFMAWPGWREGLWQQLCREAAAMERPLAASLGGADRDAEAVAAARQNLARLELLGPETVECRELVDQPVRSGSGLLICNPPYGLRLETGDLSSFYAELGHRLRHSFPGWRLALVCPDPVLMAATGLEFRLQATLDNGGLQVGLYVCTPA